MDNGIWADGGLRVSVLSLNCWGIAQISKDRLPRMAAISEQLKSGTYDFVFLQEVWVEEDFKLIAKVVAKVLPYSHYFHSGVIGGGICIFSSAPIVDVFFQAWSLNGHMHKIQHGDWFGGKGVGLCTVLYQGLKINLYVTHVSFLIFFFFNLFASFKYYLISFSFMLNIQRMMNTKLIEWSKPLKLPNLYDTHGKMPTSAYLAEI